MSGPLGTPLTHDEIDPDEVRRIDRESPDTVGSTVVETVAAVNDTQPEELASRLYDVVDPDALERLFRPREGSGRNHRVTFTMENCVIVVDGDDDEVLVSKRDA